VQHKPDRIGLIQAYLDKVIAGAERAQMVIVVGVFQPRIFLHDPAKALREFPPCLIDPFRRRIPGTLIALARRTPMWHGPFDSQPQGGKVIGQIGGHERGLNRS
jgi:hypothetical protein